MSKAVLISIRPKWCEMIANGKKTIEVRKTAPKVKTPFKCYIYCTKFHPGDPDSMINLKGRKSFFMPQSCMVIGHFVCDRIIEWHYIPDPDESADPGSMAYDVLTVDGEATGLEDDDFEDYGKGAPLYGWHISDLMIYDVPKQLREFKAYRTKHVTEKAFFQEGVCDEIRHVRVLEPLRRPPQSWCYVVGYIDINRAMADVILQAISMGAEPPKEET